MPRMSIAEEEEVQAGHIRPIAVMVDTLHGVGNSDDSERDGEATLVDVIASERASVTEKAI